MTGSSGVAAAILRCGLVAATRRRGAEAKSRPNTRCRSHGIHRRGWSCAGGGVVHRPLVGAGYTLGGPLRIQLHDDAFRRPDHDRCVCRNVNRLGYSCGHSSRCALDTAAVFWACDRADDVRSDKRGLVGSWPKRSALNARGFQPRYSL
jgi:hypothetical protein